jgi:hypothetical protein
MLKKIAISTVAILALGQTLLADDYYLYGTWNIDNHYNIYDITGYIDKNNRLKGGAESEYVIFNDGGIGYIYKVEVNGDANAHPDVNGQPIADRIFTFVSSSPNTLPSSAGEDEFYVDDTGIYFGSGEQIKYWDFNWSNETNVLTNGNLWTQTLARNISTGEWWTASWGRKVYKYNNSTNQWEYQFTYPSLSGWHHDGMEIVGDKLYLSDMTSDKIIEYELNATGQVSDPSSHNIYSYTANPDVGYGIWSQSTLLDGWRKCL